MFGATKVNTPTSQPNDSSLLSPWWSMCTDPSPVLLPQADTGMGRYWSQYLPPHTYPPPRPPSLSHTHTAQLLPWRRFLAFHKPTNCTDSCTHTFSRPNHWTLHSYVMKKKARLTESPSLSLSLLNCAQTRTLANVWRFWVWTFSKDMSKAVGHSLGTLSWYVVFTTAGDSQDDLSNQVVRHAGSYSDPRLHTQLNPAADMARLGCSDWTFVLVNKHGMETDRFTNLQYKHTCFSRWSSRLFKCWQD